jgi:hypothetical protein
LFTSETPVQRLASQSTRRAARPLSSVGTAPAWTGCRRDELPERGDAGEAGRDLVAEQFVHERDALPAAGRGVTDSLGLVCELAVAQGERVLGVKQVYARAW